jgi:hypothetical protein
MKEDKKTDLDQLIDDFNKKTVEQFEEILSTINAINSELREFPNWRQRSCGAL